ncbi:UNVERIFIED_CONTAM: hypothetical protein PYX00_000997 [Menopon gallinae]
MICKKDDLNGYTNLVDIIVTTAGRLVDHLMNTDGISFKHLKYLVIDEADRVMDDMQNDWLYHLNKRLLSDSSKSYQTPVLTYNTLLGRRKLPQKLLFSATLSQDPEKLQQLGLFQPKLFTSVVSSNAAEESVSVNRFIGKYTTPAELQEYYTLSTKAMKPLVVHHLLKTESWRSVLCFVNSVQSARRLAFLLKKLSNGLKVHCITAKLSPVSRDRMIEKFAKGRIDVLISSDALARGIDIPNVKYVISYNRPRYLKTYIHRIGRTGRAGKVGVSLILLTEKEEKQFRQMIESAGKKEVNEMTVDEEVLEQYTEEYQKALRKLESLLEREKIVTLSAMKSNKIKNKRFRKF